MRTSADMPRRLPRASRRTRIAILVGLVVVIVGFASLSGLAHFWTDYLWFRSTGITSVFKGVLLTKVLLALIFIVIFGLIIFASLYVADRVAPDDIGEDSPDELVARYRDLVFPHRNVVRIVATVVFAVLAGIGANKQWNNWDLFRYHSSFGVKDAEYHRDIGFYVFQLPFIKFLIGWAFEAFVVVLIVTVVVHYLNGGIQIQGSARGVTPAVKTHISVLLGILAVIKAFDYYYQRLALVLSRDHVVNGATATNIHADKPAKTLLIVIALIAAGLFLFNIRQKGWTLPAVGVALWGLVYILVGAAYPAIYQALRVNPSELTRESVFIQRNINATRAAYGIDQVQVDNQYQYDPTVTKDQIQGGGVQQIANQQTLSNVRLLDPKVNLKGTFRQYQGFRGYYEFNDLDLDRYVLPSARAETATIASVRELSQAQVPSGFVNQRLAYTHGYGAVVAPISQAGVKADGTPNFTLKNLPAQGSPSLTPQGSEIYYGLGSDTSSYVIAGSKTSELDYQNPKTDAQVTTKYQGNGGVKAGSLLRRLAFALRFSDTNFILSGQVTPSSRVMYIRNINDRVRKAAPFLKFDSDPYAVVLNGSVYWVIDAYTTSDAYPYSQEANLDRLQNTNSGLLSSFNYVRNSVKVVISAYDGSMHFIVMDSFHDPIIKVYERVFPELFTPVAQADQLPGLTGITAHFRYPEDLFRVQTNMYGRYHQTNPTDFYKQAQSWAVSIDPGSGPLNSTNQNAPQFLTPSSNANALALPPVSEHLDPQYVLAHLPGSTQQSFMLITPFVPYVPPTSQTPRNNLTAFMTVSSDPADYGRLKLYETPPGQTVDSPALVPTYIRSNTTISSQLSLLNQQNGGSTVELGEVVIVPIDQTLVYVQPVYVEPTSTQNSAQATPTLRRVVVVYNSNAYLSTNASIDNALCQVTNPDGTRPFSSYCNTAAATGNPVNGTTTPPPVSQPTVTVPSGSNAAALLSKAQQAFAAATTALHNGELGVYQADVAQAQAYVAQAEQLLSATKPSTKP